MDNPPPHGKEIRCAECYGVPGLHRQAAYKNHGDLLNISNATNRVRHGHPTAVSAGMGKTIHEA